MTQPLHTTLTQLTHHLHHLETTLHDQPLQPPQWSQTNARTHNSHPTPPCNLATLDYLTDIEPTIKGWCYNLTTDTPASTPPIGQPLHAWTTWLHINIHHLETVTWIDDCAQELTDLETQLRHHIHPDNPHHTLEHRITAKTACARLATMGHRITPELLRQWAKRGKITTTHNAEGKNLYSIPEILNAI